MLWRYIIAKTAYFILNFLPHLLGACFDEKAAEMIKILFCVKGRAEEPTAGHCGFLPEE